MTREDVCNELRKKYGESVRDMWLYPDLLDARLKIQELEAELSRLKEEHEKELREAVTYGYAEYANDPYGTSEESVVAAFLSSRKQENDKKEELK